MGSISVTHLSAITLSNLLSIFFVIQVHVSLLYWLIFVSYVMSCFLTIYYVLFKETFILKKSIVG